jgi:hypothetical protein
MNEEIDLTNNLRRLASTLPREASPRVEQNLAAVFRARHPRKIRLWISAATAAVLLLSLTLLRKHPPPRQDYVVYNVAGFVALPYAQSGVPLESVVVIRVQMRPAELSSIGVAVPATASTAQFTADLLVGQDGVARAIRLVE